MLPCCIQHVAWENRLGDTSFGVRICADPLDTALTRNTDMAVESELKEILRHQRLSLQNLRRGVIIFGMSAIALVIVQQFIRMRLWIPFTILGVLSFTIVGDAANYLYLGLQLRKHRYM